MLPRFRPLIILVAILSLACPRLDALDQPVSPGALPVVGQVLDFLQSISGHAILAGQQEQVDWYGKDNEPEMNYLLATTGRLPAVRSFDFMFLSISNPEGRRGQRVAERAIEWRDRGGLVHVSYHWNAGAPRESFYTKDSDFDLARALTPGHRDHDEFVAEMDVVAEELKLLRDAGVPVIWRPFHEVNGSSGPTTGTGAWFWWGARGPTTFQQAWRFMFDRFTRHHGLTNLIWCYNPTDVAGALEAWYPGDDYVDLISYDLYPPAGTRSTAAAMYQRLVAFRGGRKVFALTENGPIPDPDALAADGAGWTFFSTWDRSFILDGVLNPPAFLQRVYQHERVITLDELPALLPIPPRITVAPRSVEAPIGAPVTLAVGAAGPGPLAYQWFKDGIPLPGATGPTCPVLVQSSADAGTYTVTVSNASGGPVTPPPVELVMAEGAYQPPTSRIVNLSTRGAVGVEADMLIAGFVIAGPGAKPLLIRAVGPTLLDYGVTGVLADPAIRLFDQDRRPLQYEDDWSSDPVRAAEFQRIGEQAGAFALRPGSRDAVMLVTLPPGAYTATVRSPLSGTGEALLELYDLDPASAARLINISSRARVSPTRPLIAGFVVRGHAPRPLLLRGVGPALVDHGISDALVNPLMTLHDHTTMEIDRNDDWPAQTMAAFTRNGAFALPIGSRDAVLVRTVEPQLYSAIIRAPTGTAGVALVEIYEDRQ
jgi:hypothetical protein